MNLYLPRKENSADFSKAQASSTINDNACDHAGSTAPEHTGLLFSLEPVFSAIFALVFLHEILLRRNYLGAASVPAGVVLSSVFDCQSRNTSADAIRNCAL